MPKGQQFVIESSVFRIACPTGGEGFGQPTLPAVLQTGDSSTAPSLGQGACEYFAASDAHPKEKDGFVNDSIVTKQRELTP